jgi:hypothetical protein
MRESVIEKKARAQAKLYGMLYIKLIPFGRIGIPDRLVLAPGGRVLFLEIKTEKGIQSKRQEMWQRRLRTLGFLAVCSYGLENTMSVLDAFASNTLRQYT